ncbi:MAG: hypothetical protein RIQ81_1062 [Pseudomonadota bacterium]|jgi:hypothetical protein
MVPFRVFDRDKKEMWIVLNYQSGGTQGSYLLSREDDGDSDGELRIIKAEDMLKFRLVDFLEEADEYQG